MLASVEGFFRVVLALLMKADAGVVIEVAGPRGPQRLRELGRIDSSDWLRDDRALYDLGLGDDDLRAVANRLSTALSGFAALRSELQSANRYSAKYERVTDWFGTRPVVDLEMGGRCEQLLVPSPGS